MKQQQQRRCDDAAAPVPRAAQTPRPLAARRGRRIPSPQMHCTHLHSRTPTHTGAATHRVVSLPGGPHAVVGGLQHAVGPAGEGVADVDGEASGAAASGQGGGGGATVSVARRDCSGAACGIGMCAGGRQCPTNPPLLQSAAGFVDIEAAGRHTPPPSAAGRQRSTHLCPAGRCPLAAGRPGSRSRSPRVQRRPLAGDRHPVPDVADVLDQRQVLHLVARRNLQPRLACSGGVRRS